ncbi:UDP-N-acetylmuramate--L-alanine ligase [Ornithinimicrobium panacihumi]|uniref:UDP-N-acetylmuramate--L-alanine ligase n=1 Tax=Ornithinimicrobium panacihumi TaxID=2008449 RepID=UPI003F8AFFA1
MSPALATPRFDFTAPVPPVTELGRVHFIAIGGSGMSAVARLYLEQGVSVSGSDRSDGAALRELQAEGATVHVGHDPAHVADVDTVVISSAIPEDNVELAAARAAGLRVLHRAQGIAALLPGRDAIAVAGANGKTTTSAMTTVALQAAGAEPGYVIGAPLAQTGSNAASGAPGSPIVVEADESDGSFLVYRPLVAVVTNVQPDHLDFYGDYAAVQEAYAAFVGTIRPGGLLVTNADDAGAARLAGRAREAGVRVLTWGTGPEADVRLTDLSTTGRSARATLTLPDARTVRLDLPVPGLHALHNATAALLATTVGLGLPMEQALAGLAGFGGAHRRFEPKGEAAGVEIVDDYAHNAPKVAALVHAARTAADGRRLVVAFQPHLFSRTRDFAEGFADGLAGADVLVLLPIYGARETQEQYPEVTSGLLADLVRSRGTGVEVHETADLASAPHTLRTLVREGDLVVTVGAGDVTTVGPRLLDLLREDTV